MTRFFRDPETFEILTKKIFGEILRNKTPDAPIRLWVPGCSTGEEVYSLTICLLEFLGDKAPNVLVQVFGSDISDQALEKARAATYLENIENDVSPQRLRRFFTKANGHYQVNKSVRDLCVFAKQNIVRDPPFSKLDLISCRNVLIYLNPELQKKVFPIFHFSLNPQGWLLLGSAETVGSSSDLFTVVDQTHRIFAKNANVPPRLNLDSATSSYVSEPSEKSLKAFSGGETQPARMNVQKETDRALIDMYAPSGVIVNDNLEIVQFRGDANPYFQIPSGEANLKLLKMAREGLQADLNAAIKEVRKTNAPFRKRGLRVEYNGQTKKVELVVIPITTPLSTERYWGLMFEEEKLSVPGLKKTARSAPKRISNNERKDDDNRWKKELASTKTYLESVIEEKETAFEELQSANEEVLSSNEELQSINEEMQTAREELQSTNEELTTINDELHHSNLQSLQLADDLNNFLDSVRIPVVMVGIDLKIRRFTPPAETMLHLLPSDIGRPIGDINNRMKIVDFEKILLEALDNVVIKEQQVQDEHGRWYSMRIHPYKTADKKIDGAVIVFLDVETMKQTEISITKARDSAEDILATAREAFVVLDSKLQVKQANPAFYRAFHVKPEETEGRHIYDLGGGQWNIPKLKILLEEIIPKNNSFKDFEVEHEFPEIGRKFMILNATKVFHTQGEELILLAIEDITEAKRAASELAQKADELHHNNVRSLQLADDLNNFLDSVRIPVVMVGIDLKIRRFTPPAEKVLNLLPSDIGRPIGDINTRVKINDFEKYLLEAIDNVVIKEQQVQDGEGRWYTMRIHPYKTADKKIDGAVVVLLDVETMKQTEISITKALGATEDILATMREPFLVLDSSLRIRRANKSFYKTFHVSAEDTEGRQIYDLGNGEWNIPTLRTLLEEIIPKNNSIKDFEVEHEFQAIGQKTMLLNASRIRHREEELVLLAIEDITERKRAGEAQKILAAIVGSSDDAIISKDVKGIINSWNQGAERLFGYTAEEAIGQSVSILIPPERKGEEERILERIYRGEHIHHYETVRQRKDGSFIDIALTISPIRGAQGQIIGASKIARDTTERKQMANELARKAADLSRSNRDLEDFAHVVSHDLQSPLNKISAFGDLLKMEIKSALSEKGVDYLDLIQNGAQKMTRLIGGLLNYSKITSSGHKPESVDMAALAREIIGDLDMQIKEIGAKVTVAELPTVQANPMQMNQLITNLVSNAVKYCGNAAPVIDIAAKQEGTFWVFSVRDNCIGIDSKDAQRIFDLFQRVGAGVKPGTGIGLTICKKIVENHGGRIWVESEPGKGSTFYFTLPIK